MEAIFEAIKEKALTDPTFLYELKTLMVKHGMYKEARDIMEYEAQKGIPIPRYDIYEQGNTTIITDRINGHSSTIVRGK